MNAQLQITRRTHLIGWARGARITMDGAEIASVSTGKTITLEVPPGKHVLSAWLGSSPSAQTTVDFVPGGEYNRPIELPHLETFPVAACCQPIELPGYPAAAGRLPSRRLGRSTRGGFAILYSFLILQGLVRIFRHWTIQGRRSFGLVYDM